MRSILRWRLRWIPVLLATAVILLIVTPPGRAGLKGIGLVMQVVPEFPVKPLQWFTPTPSRTQVTFEVNGAGQTGNADLYRIPGRKHQAAVVLFLGVTPAGRDDPRVVNLGMGLARAGFAVLVPWAKDMQEGRVSPGDVTMLVSAFQYLRSQPFVDPSRVGMGGFCVGSSLLAVAAAEAPIRNEVAFLHFFSGYYNARDFLAEYASRTAFLNGHTRSWVPDPLVGQVFSHLLIENLPNATDRAVLQSHFLNGQSISNAEIQSLSGDGQTVYKLLSGVPLEEARKLVAELPSNELQEMDFLSPSSHIRDLKTRVFIIHDRADNMVPVEESERLAQALKPRGNYTFTEFSFFQHVDPDKHVSPFTFIHDAFKLFEDLYHIARYAS